MLYFTYYTNLNSHNGYVDISNVVRLYNLWDLEIEDDWKNRNSVFDEIAKEIQVNANPSGKKLDPSEIFTEEVIH